MKKRGKRLEIEMLESEIQKVREKIKKLKIEIILLQLRKAKLEGRPLRDAVTPF